MIDRIPITWRRLSRRAERCSSGTRTSGGCGPRDALSQAGTQVTVDRPAAAADQVLDAGPFDVGLLTTFEFLAFLRLGCRPGVGSTGCGGATCSMVADLVRGLLYGSLPLAWRSTC